VHVLAIDGGKTKSLLAHYHDGERREVVRVGGLENIAAPDGAEQIRRTLASAIGTEIARGPWDAVSIGLTSVHAHTPHAELMLDILAGLVDARQAVVSSDVVTTYSGAIGLEPGAVVAAGTGSIAMGLSAEHASRVDGWGYLVGDEGSGFDIGRAGLRSVLRELDGRGGSPALVDRAREHFGSIERLIPTLYGSSLPAATVAAFSAGVALAAIDGDAVSRRIWQDAAESLAEMAVSAATQVATDTTGLRLSYSGGLFSADELLRVPFLAAVERRLPGANVHAPLGDALDGAALLGSVDEFPMFDRVVTRRHLSTKGPA
jgi:glucosamine kinase